MMIWVELFASCTVQALLLTCLSVLSLFCGVVAVENCGSDSHFTSFHVYPCHDCPAHVSVLCVLVCAGRFAPVALGCTNMLKFLTNCSFDGDTTNNENSDFNMLLSSEVLIINILESTTP
jgi:hypothetical protein